MKLISLNIWGGRIFNPLLDFIKLHSRDTDIFCLQEVFNNELGVFSKIQKEAKLDIFSDLKSILPDFDFYINPAQKNEESLAIFVKKTITLQKIDEIFLYRSKNTMIGKNIATLPVNLQYITFQYNDKKFIVCNLHGHWTPEGKGDNVIRLEQSRKIENFLNTFTGAKILCGDFNLAPNTESIKILEAKMKNLIKEYNITSTSSHYYKRGIKFADYAMVSPEVAVKDFQVLPDVVSDHLALYLDFE